MKKLLLTALAVPFLLAGCLPAVDGQNYYLTEGARVKTAKACESLRAIGEYADLRVRINRDVLTIKDLLKQDDLEEVRAEVKSLGQRIRDNSDRLIRITDSPFVEINVDQKLKWALGPELLGIRKKGQPAVWGITRVEIDSLFNWQGESADLREFTSLKFDRENILVKFQRPASALEICQLQQTLVIVLKVDFRGPFGQRKTMHYNLLAQNARK